MIPLLLDKLEFGRNYHIKIWDTWEVYKCINVLLLIDGTQVGMLQSKTHTTRVRQTQENPTVWRLWDDGPYNNQCVTLSLLSDICEHEYINVGFMALKMICKKCGRDQQ